jgi:transposase
MLIRDSLFKEVMEITMRGHDQTSGSLFSYIDLEDRVPSNHPLRIIREVVDDVLASLSPDFEAMYSRMGRPSIPPEQLLRALLLQAFYTVRSERQLIEQLNFNTLFRWFVGLGMDEPVWEASTFCKNRDRLLEAGVSARLLNGVIEHRKVRRLLSRDQDDGPGGRKFLVGPKFRVDRQKQSLLDSGELKHPLPLALWHPI